MAAKGRKQRQVRETAVRSTTGPTPETYRAFVTSKGRVTIPVALRKKLNITPTTRLVVSDDGELIFIKPMNVAANPKRSRAQ